MSESREEKRRARSDLTVGVGGRAVGAGDLAPGVGRREGLEVGVGELDGLRIWPRRRLQRREEVRREERWVSGAGVWRVGTYRDGSGGLGVVEGGVATAGHHLGRRRRRGSFGAEQSVSPREVKRGMVLLVGSRDVAAVMNPRHIDM
jgi:hypothetical protein